MYPSHTSLFTERILTQLPKNTMNFLSLQKHCKHDFKGQQTLIWYDTAAAGTTDSVPQEKERSVHQLCVAMLFGWKQSTEMERKIPATDGI